MKKASEAERNELLIAAREAKQLTPIQVANLIDCPDVRTYYRWERGEYIPSPKYRKKLCKLLGKEPDELGISQPARTSNPPNSTNVPIHLPRLVGRKEAIDDICDLLQNPDIRLLTLTGAPGIGKTSLAKHVVNVLLNNDAYAKDVIPVELEAINGKDGDTVINAVARKFDLKDTGILVLERLKMYLRDKQLLLILDSCEHFIQACAELAEALLKSCPHLTLLTTSTELLNIKEGEWLFVVEPLQYPNLDHLPPTEQLREYSAIQLFEMRRQMVTPGFVVSDENASVIAQICARMDGHPLAIRLAAGSQTRSEWQIAEQLDNCLTLLRGGSRTGAKRHMSLQETIDWSYDPLPEDEKLLLQRLSVFSGGWTLEAAEVVCAGDGLEIENIQEMIEDLARKSLVEVEKSEESWRSRLLETIRQYAKWELRDGGKAENIYRRHRDFFYHKAEEHRLNQRGLYHRQQSPLRAEHGNLQAALHWCYEKDRGEAFLRFIAALWYYWTTDIVLFNEGRSWVIKALEMVDETTPTRASAEVLIEAASIFEIGGRGKDSQGHILVKKSMEIYKALGDEYFVLVTQILYLTMTHHNRAASLGAIFVNIFSLPDKLLMYGPGVNKSMFSPKTLYYKSQIAMAENNTAEARTLLENALQQYKEQADSIGEADCLYGLGAVSLEEGKYQDALVCFIQSLTLYRCGETFGLEGFHINMLIVKIHDLSQVISYKDAVVCLKEIMEQALYGSSSTNDLLIVCCLFFFCFCAFHCKWRVKATCILGSLLACHCRKWSFMRTLLAIIKTGLRKVLGKQTFRMAWDEGRLMTLEEAVANACMID